MTRFATTYGAFEIESLPSQPQVAVCHAFFVRQNMRGQGHGHNLKAYQADALESLNYDYALCTCKGENAAQQKVLADAGWKSSTRSSTATRVAQFNCGAKLSRRKTWPANSRFGSTAGPTTKAST